MGALLYAAHLVSFQYQRFERIDAPYSDQPDGPLISSLQRISDARCSFHDASLEHLVALGKQSRRMVCQLARYARYSFLTSTTLEFLSGLGACCLCGSLWPGKVLAKSGDQDRSRAISG